MATAAPDIYETNLAQAVYETSPEQVVSPRADGLHFLPVEELEREAFMAQWLDLIDHCAEPNPHFEPRILIPCFQQPDHTRNLGIAAYYQRGELCGLIPLARGASYLGYPIPCTATWQHSKAANGVPLVREGYEQPFWQELLHTLDTSPGGALFLHLPRLSEQGPVNQALQTVITRQRRSAATVTSRELVQPAPNDVQQRDGSAIETHSLTLHTGHDVRPFVDWNIAIGGRLRRHLCERIVLKASTAYPG